MIVLVSINILLVFYVEIVFLITFNLNVYAALTEKLIKIWPPQVKRLSTSALNSDDSDCTTVKLGIYTWRFFSNGLKKKKKNQKCTQLTNKCLGGSNEPLLWIYNIFTMGREEGCTWVKLQLMPDKEIRVVTKNINPPHEFI